MELKTWRCSINVAAILLALAFLLVSLGLVLASGGGKTPPPPMHDTITVNPTSQRIEPNADVVSDDQSLRFNAPAESRTLPPV